MILIENRCFFDPSRSRNRLPIGPALEIDTFLNYFNKTSMLFQSRLLLIALAFKIDTFLNYVNQKSMLFQSRPLPIAPALKIDAFLNDFN